MRLVHNYYPHTPSSDPYLFTSKFESLPHKGELLWFSHNTPFPSFYVLSITSDKYLFRIEHCFIIGKETDCFRPGKLEKENRKASAMFVFF